MAYTIEDGQSADIHVLELSGARAPQRLTLVGHNRFPGWSAAGDRVAFQSDRDGDAAIFWQQADGTSVAERLTKPEAGSAHVPYAWSPDGHHVLFGVVTGARTSLWTLSVSDRKAERFGRVESRVLPNAAFFPDGRWVAYVSDSGGSVSSVFVQPFPATGATYQASLGNGGSPFWSPDGSELFYVRGPDEFVAVKVATKPSFSVGTPVLIQTPGRFGRAGAAPRDYDIMADGKRFVIIVPAGIGATGSVQSIHVVLNWFEELKNKK